MLRYVLGDADFFAALNQYFNDNLFGTVWTDDFRDALEDYLGEDIDWFFDTWIHGYGYPIYEIDHNSVASGGGWELTIDVAQVQSTPTIFEMPLEFLVEGVSQDTLVVMWNDSEIQSEAYQISFEPQNVVFDPYTHILCGNVLTGIEEMELPPEGVSTVYLAPNPARNSTTIFWPGTEENTLMAAVYDLSGRIVHEQSLDPGERAVRLPSGLPSATYLMQITTDGGIRQTTRLVVVD
jgi:aminopeptidase N